MCSSRFGKICLLFDVENRLIPVTEESGHLIDVSKIKENIDENTIGILLSWDQLSLVPLNQLRKSPNCWMKLKRTWIGY